MKKIYLLTAMAVMFVGFIACSDEDTASPVDYTKNVDVSNYQTATISGVALATLDATLAPDVLQYAPKGTKLFLTIANSELYANGLSFRTDDGSGTFMLETTVGENGEFSFTVPTKNSGVTVTIKGDNFKADYKVSETNTETRIYGPGLVASPATITAYPDGIVYVTFQFGSGQTYPVILIG